MKFVMFTNNGGWKIAINKDRVDYIEEGDGGTIIWMETESKMVIVREDFATVHSRLNIIEG